MTEVMHTPVVTDNESARRRFNSNDSDKTDASWNSWSPPPSKGRARKRRHVDQQNLNPVDLLMHFHRSEPSTEDNKAAQVEAKYIAEV